MATDAKANGSLRVYQTWQGNEVFFCKGFIVAGPNWKAPFGSALLIVAPTAVFLAFPATYLTLHVHAIIMVFSCLLPALSIAFLFMTAFRDPGVIPRQEPDEEFLAGRKPRTKEVLVNNQRVVIRYNDTCHFYQPPRAHHCSVNDNCIERFDHHCPWVGTTIGKRNYRTFLLFVYTTTVLCLYVMGCCLAQLFLVHNDVVNEEDPVSDPWGHTLRQVIPALVLLGFTFVFVWFVGGLSAFHCYLVGSNQTTYENFRYNHDDRPNPYNMGLLRNCFEVWCTPTPPSRVDFRAFVDSQQAAPAASEDDAERGRSHSHDGNGSQHQEREMERTSSGDSQGAPETEMTHNFQRTTTGHSGGGFVTSYGSQMTRPETPGASGVAEAEAGGGGGGGGGYQALQPGPPPAQHWPSSRVIDSPTAAELRPGSWSAAADSQPHAAASPRRAGSPLQPSEIDVGIPAAGSGRRPGPGPV